MSNFIEDLRNRAAERERVAREQALERETLKTSAREKKKIEEARNKLCDQTKWDAQSVFRKLGITTAVEELSIETHGRVYSNCLDSQTDSQDISIHTILTWNGNQSHAYDPFDRFTVIVGYHSDGRLEFSSNAGLIFLGDKSYDCPGEWDIMNGVTVNSGMHHVLGVRSDFLSIEQWSNNQDLVASALQKAYGSPLEEHIIPSYDEPLNRN